MDSITAKLNELVEDNEDLCDMDFTVAELAVSGVGGCCAGPDLFKDILKFGHGHRRVKAKLVIEENCVTDFFFIEGLSEEEATKLEEDLSLTHSYVRYDSVYEGWTLWEDE